MGNKKNKKRRPYSKKVPRLDRRGSKSVILMNKLERAIQDGAEEENLIDTVSTDELNDFIGVKVLHEKRPILKQCSLINNPKANVPKELNDDISFEKSHSEVKFCKKLISRTVEKINNRSLQTFDMASSSISHENLSQVNFSKCFGDNKHDSFLVVESLFVDNSLKNLESKNLPACNVVSSFEKKLIGCSNTFHGNENVNTIIVNDNLTNFNETLDEKKSINITNCHQTNLHPNVNEFNDNGHVHGYNVVNFYKHEFGSSNAFTTNTTSIDNALTNKTFIGNKLFKTVDCNEIVLDTDVNKVEDSVTFHESSIIHSQTDSQETSRLKNSLINLNIEDLGAIVTNEIFKHNDVCVTKDSITNTGLNNYDLKIDQVPNFVKTDNKKQSVKAAATKIPRVVANEKFSSHQIYKYPYSNGTFVIRSTDKVRAKKEKNTEFDDSSCWNTLQSHKNSTTMICQNETLADVRNKTNDAELYGSIQNLDGFKNSSFEKIPIRTYSNLCKNSNKVYKFKYKQCSDVNKQSNNSKVMNPGSASLNKNYNSSTDSEVINENDSTRCFLDSNNYFGNLNLNCERNEELENNDNLSELKESDNNYDFDDRPYFEEAKIQGRRITDLSWIFEQLHDAFDSHYKVCEGRFADLRIHQTIDKGLRTLMLWGCRKCDKKVKIWSDPEEPADRMNLHEAAVLSTLITGGGYSSLQEQFAALDIPCISHVSYRKYRDNVGKTIYIVSKEDMIKAGQLERKLAIEAGDIIKGRNGKPDIPFTKVIVDGAWAKRSYRGGRYDALSGTAVIIGERTGLVLFCGTRNKLCTGCIRNTVHECFKNWGRDQTSTSMESDIILEGFRSSIDMHGLIYESVIGDGDSSVYKSILDNDPYAEYSIRVNKIECKNHLFRNFCDHIEEVSRKTKFLCPVKKGLVKALREQVKSSALKMRKFIESAMVQRKKEQVPIAEQIKRLLNDINNAPYHIFGEHKNCEKATDGQLSESCKNISTNKVDFLRSIGMFIDIKRVVDRLAINVGSLLKNMTSNPAELYNSIANKFHGGRRINNSMRNSFELRAHCAVIQFNNKVSLSIILTYLGKPVSNIVSQMEESRLKQIDYTTRYRQNGGRKRRRYQGTDKDYGPHANTADASLNVYNLRKDDHLQKLQERQQRREKIMKETTNQSSCGDWHMYRADMITASNFGDICNKRAQTSCAGIVKKIRYPTPLNTADIVFGKENEKQAIKELEKKISKKIEPCGLFIDEKLEYLGASPDGLIDDDGIVEIKCLAAAKHLTPDQAIVENSRYRSIFNKKNKNIMNTSHKYYYQVQGQLHVTQRNYCYFALWTPRGLKYVSVKKDDIFWNTKMEPRLTSFFYDCLLPEIVDSRVNRRMPIRDPEYILKAQEESKKKKQLAVEKKEKKKHDTNEFPKKRKKNIIRTDSPKKRRKLVTSSKSPKEKRKISTTTKSSKKRSKVTDSKGPKKRRKSDTERMKVPFDATVEDDVSNENINIARNDVWVPLLPNSDIVLTEEQMQALDIVRHNIDEREVINNISSTRNQLSDEAVEYFLQIIENNTVYNTFPVMYSVIPSLITPSVTTQDLQIIGGNTSGHWTCLHYDGTNLLIYDSLLGDKKSRLSSDERRYVEKRYPWINESDVIFRKVTLQNDKTSCGAYAAAFATTIALGGDPSDTHLSTSAQEIRDHLIKIIQKRKLISFPTQ